MEVCCGRRRRSADNNIMADGMVGGRWLLGSDQKKGLKRRVIFFMSTSEASLVLVQERTLHCGRTVNVVRKKDGRFCS